MAHRRMPGGVAALLVLVTLVGCTTGEASPDTEKLAVLRAVPALTEQEPLYAELRAAGFVRDGTLEVLSDLDEVYPDPEDAAEAVAAWVEEGVDLIVAFSTTGAEVVREVAPQVNVLFLSNDPSATGLVRNEASPEGRLTGVTFRVPADRTLDLARRALPRLTHVGLLYPPADPAAGPHRDAVQAAARELGIAVSSSPFRSVDDVPAAVERLAADGVDALFASNSPTAVRALDAVQTQAAAHGLPVIANTTVADRALVVLSPDTDEILRQLGRQAVRLLSGADVGDVPVEDPDRFVTTFDSRAAAELGIELPEGVLRRADEVLR